MKNIQFINASFMTKKVMRYNTRFPEAKINNALFMVAYCPIIQRRFIRIFTLVINIQY